MNVTKVCRTCLQEKNSLVSLYSVDINTGIQVCDMILQTSQVQVFNKENAPSSICNECHYKLNVAFQFQQQCKNSELKLQEFMRNYSQQSEANEKEIEAAVQELFGNEGSEQDINFQPNMVLTSDLDSNLKSSDLLNMDMILGGENNKTPKKLKKVNKPKNIKGKSHLDELLKNHKERMKIENSSKIQIFKQRRKKKLTALTEPEQCFQCGKVFHYKGYMELHLRTHSNYKAYVCNICQKRFTQVSNLNLHLRTHSKEKPFCCEKCPKMFSTSSNLKAHLRIHENFKPFQCSLCNKAFKSSTELKSHEGTHSQIKNKICKFCNKSFYKTSYLNVHIKNIHYGLKKYQCDGCNKSFSNSSNLIAHKRIHSGEKPYHCKFEGCNAKFNQSSSLVRHMKSHNKPSKKTTSEKQKDKQTLETIVEQQPQQQQQIEEEVQPQIQHEIQIPPQQMTIQHQNYQQTQNQSQISTNQEPTTHQFYRPHQLPNSQSLPTQTHEIIPPQLHRPHQMTIQPQQQTKPVKKTPYIIPELLKDLNISDNSSSSSSIEPLSQNRIKNLPSCQQQQNNQISQQSYVPPPQQSLLPEALNPLNLISNSSNSNYNHNHSTPSLLLVLPPHHEPPSQVSDHQMHHFQNFETSTTTYLPATPNMLPNSFNFIMGNLDFSKNSLNGEPTYIDY
ncbi:hypothetical protein PVAND_015898 [Polypedilum vanderplanki]|uniref:Zinc finger protein n=1 Tax=Polypedilum vanderplanki TaxID=319348 RepID=A0A9J6BDW5_POLVA|nr:hypothetical protein PVAND_015898 [Polypedilum vanderplanki]